MGGFAALAVRVKVEWCGPAWRYWGHPCAENKVLRRRLGSSERENTVMLVLCSLGVFFLLIFEGLGGACDCKGSSKERCFCKSGQTFTRQIQNLWDKKGAEDWGDAGRASPRGSRELAASARSFHCSLKPQNPYFQVQNFSEAINTSFLN